MFELDGWVGVWWDVYAKVFFDALWVVYLYHILIGRTYISLG